MDYARTSLPFAGIFLNLLLVCSVFSHDYAEPSTNLKDNAVYRSPSKPIFLRKLLSYNTGDKTSNHSWNSGVPNAMVFGDNREFGDHLQIQKSQNKVMNGKGEKLEWKIDVHVARHTTNSKSPVTDLSSELSEKLPRNFDHKREDEIKSAILKPDGGLGMKLTVEGSGGESSYTDLQKAWILVAKLIKSFGEGTDNALRNMDVNMFTANKSVFPYQVDKSHEANRLASNATQLHYLLASGEKIPLMSRKTSTEVAFISDESNTVEEFLEVKQVDDFSSKESYEELNFGSHLNKEIRKDCPDASELEAPVSTSTESHGVPRFLFESFDQGSGHAQTFATTGSTENRGRESRFIFGLFRPRVTQSPDTKEFGSGDNSQDVEQRRSFRVETGHQLPCVENHETPTKADISEQSPDENTDISTEKEGRFLFGIFEVGSGESRDLSVADRSDEMYTNSTPLEQESFDDTEITLDSAGETSFSNNDYFLESVTDSYSFDAHDAVEYWNKSHSDVYSDGQTSLFNRETNESQYDFEDEVLFLSLENSVTETTKLNDATNLNPRFFGVFFSEGSADGDVAFRNVGNETQTSIPVVAELGPSEENFLDNESINTSVSETYSTSDNYSRNNDEIVYAGGMAQDTYRAETSVEQDYQDLTAPEEKNLSSDFYFIDNEDNHEYNNSEASLDNMSDSVTSYYDDSQDIFSDSVAHNRGNGSLSGTTEDEALSSRRGARLLSGSDCFFPDCSVDLQNIHSNASFRIDNEETLADKSEVSSSVYPNDSFEPETVSTSSERERTAFTLITKEPIEISGVTSPLYSDSEEGYHSYDVGLSEFHSSNDAYGYSNSYEVTADKGTYSGGRLSTSEQQERSSSLTKPNFRDDVLTKSTVMEVSSNDDSGTTTSRPHRMLPCKATWQCNDKLNERCVTTTSGSACGCGKSFVRHPSTNRCEAIAMVEAVLRFQNESYHRDLKDPTSTRYLRTEKAAKDTMKMLLEGDAELLSTIAAVEVARFEPGSLVVIWNLIVPVDGNQSLDVIVEKVDQGLKKSLDRPDVLEKLPFKSFNVDVLDVHQSDPCKTSNLNYCDLNSVCIRDASVMRGFTCKCKDGFLDLSENLNYPGEACHAACVPGYCGEHGVCEITKEGSLKCTCEGWFLGEKCQISGVVMVGTASVAIVLLIITVLLIFVLWKQKRSSTYGSDVEQRFQRTEEYGVETKGNKELCDILPMEERTAVPSRFLYLGHTPHPELLHSKVPKITVTSPTLSASDISPYDFSDSSFDSLKS